MLSSLPVEIFHHTILIGNIKGINLLNLSQVSKQIHYFCNYNKRIIFRHLLQYEYGINNVTNCWQIYKNLSTVIWHDQFNKNKATILLVDIQIEDNSFSAKQFQSILQSKYSDFQLYLRRGDIIENIASDNSYYNNGIYFYDGVNLIDPNFNVRPSGDVPTKFLVFDEFMPDYWSEELNISTIFHHDKKSVFYSRNTMILASINPIFLMHNFNANDIKPKNSYSQYTNLIFKEKSYTLYFVDSAGLYIKNMIKTGISNRTVYSRYIKDNKIEIFIDIF